MSTEPAPRRATCGHCLRPQATCLCALARPTPHRTEVLVLQHPQEQRQAKNSVALLRLSLADCEVVVGERFTPEALQALLHRTGRETRLLYPDVPAAPAPPDPGRSGLPLRLVVIDATWRKSLRMLLEHPALAALPRLSLDAPAPTRYRAIRAARGPTRCPRWRLRCRRWRCWKGRPSMASPCWRPLAGSLPAWRHGKPGRATDQ